TKSLPHDYHFKKCIPINSFILSYNSFIHFMKHNYSTQRNRYQYLACSLLFLVMGATSVFALPYNPMSIPYLFQQVSVSGQVVDENGVPLPGANVIEKGTTNGVATDMDGRFSINVASNASEVVISYLEYLETTILSDAPDAGVIALQPDTNSLEEIVLVGYGSSKRKDVTGAVASVSEDEMNEGAITNPLQLISGKAAGVIINQTGSEPGSTPSVRIRGISSLIGGNDPLVVVDGIQGNLDLLNQIPPSEIASIDILKDASATAIYGSRGAAGVLIVSTKKSKAGTTTVSYTGSMAVDYIPEKLEMLDADQWWTQAQLSGVPASANHGSNTDWYNLLTQTGFTQHHAISFGGATDRCDYRGSITAMLQDGVVINSNNQKDRGRLVATQKALDDKLTLTYNLNSSITENEGTVQSIGRASFTSNL